MMLVDNLIHSDLHPGNILVRLEQPHGLVGVAYKAVTALANPDGLPMKALGSALQQLDTKRQPGSDSKAADGVAAAGAQEAVAGVGSKSQGKGAGAPGSSSSKKRRKGAREFVKQLRSAWSAGGPAATLLVLQSGLRSVAAGWLQPHIVLLDVGMATELSNEDQTNMVGLFRCGLKTAVWRSCPQSLRKASCKALHSSITLQP
jgi:predicted unusual protein kinase regulating ubiquinone biosynthesis (AarF/ABC1/UbiB family)